MPEAFQKRVLEVTRFWNSSRMKASKVTMPSMGSMWRVSMRPALIPLKVTGDPGPSDPASSATRVTWSPGTPWGVTGGCSRPMN